MSSVSINAKNGELKKKVNLANIFLWLLQIAAAGMFIMAGGSKLAGVPEMVKSFEMIGMGQWFRYFTGLTEVVSAILLLTPAFSGVGALLLVATMLGAIATHIFILGGTFTPALVLLILGLIISFGRKDSILELVNKVLEKK